MSFREEEGKGQKAAKGWDPSDSVGFPLVTGGGAGGERVMVYLQGGGWLVFRATPSAHGSSQARGQIRLPAYATAHGIARSLTH